MCTIKADSVFVSDTFGAAVVHDVVSSGDSNVNASRARFAIDDIATLFPLVAIGDKAWYAGDAAVATSVMSVVSVEDVTVVADAEHEFSLVAADTTDVTLFGSVSAYDVVVNNIRHAHDSGGGHDDAVVKVDATAKCCPAN